MTDICLKTKIHEFEVALDRYHAHALYSRTGMFTSIAVVSMQIISIVNLITTWENNIFSVISVIIAYVFADFINGLIHMYMDNNTHYNSIVGPFIAAFHMHHAQPIYKKRNPFLVYFFESGSKFWLVGYLGLLLYVHHKITLPFQLSLMLVCFGVFSSFAELSHYWCHNVHKKNSLIRNLQKLKILLAKEHHIYHHTKDNMNYAFLNGVTDPLINLIAKYFYKGYKQNSDLHALAYRGKNTTNRI